MFIYVYTHIQMHNICIHLCIFKVMLQAIMWIGFTDIMLKQRRLTQKSILWDFPGGPVANSLRSQCRGPGFDPWSEN